MERGMLEFTGQKLVEEMWRGPNKFLVWWITLYSFEYIWKHETYNHCFSVGSYELMPFFFQYLSVFCLQSKMQLKRIKSVLRIDGYHDLYISHSEGFDLPNEDDYLVFFINLHHQQKNKVKYSESWKSLSNKVAKVLMLPMAKLCLNPIFFHFIHDVIRVSLPTCLCWKVNS